MNKFLFILFYFLFSLSLVAQTTSFRTNEALTQLRNTITKNPILKDPTLRGSPYFNQEFKQAEVSYFNENLEGIIFLRYNAFTDEIEMGTHPDQQFSEEALLKNNNIIATFGDQTYYYLPFKDKHQKTQLGYLITLHKSDEIHFLYQARKIYREATTPRTSLERAFPPRFIEEKNYYLSIQDKTPIYLGNDLKEVIKNLPSEFKSKAKEKNINLKKIKTFEHLKHALKEIY